MTEFSSSSHSPSASALWRRTGLAVALCALFLAGCAAQNGGTTGAGGESAPEVSGSTETASEATSPNTMTVAAAERKSILVCVVKDPKNPMEALERAVEEGVKATGVSTRMVAPGDDVSACRGLLLYGVAVENGQLAGMRYQMNQGDQVVLRATGPAQDGKMPLRAVAEYAASFVMHWLQPKPAQLPASSDAAAPAP